MSGKDREEGRGSRKKAQVVRKGPPNVHDLESRIQDLEDRLDAFLTACPPEFRKLAPETVEKILKMDPFVRFTVLKPYSHGTFRLSAGQTIRADQYPRLLDHVKAGLLVGRVADHEKILEKYREQAEAREAAARAAREEARALAAKLSMEALVQTEGATETPLAPSSEPEEKAKTEKEPETETDREPEEKAEA